jgi:hypothetical protein
MYGLPHLTGLLPPPAADIYATAAEQGGGDAYLTQLSLRVVTRLKTGLPGAESTRSATK